MRWRQLLTLRAALGILLIGSIITSIVCLVTAGLAGHDDHLARRWKKEIASEATGQFRSLLTAPPDPQLALPKYPPNWGKTQVAVYTVPALQPQRGRPTLRDLADIGQAHAIDFLAKGSLTEPRSWTDLEKALIDPSEAAPGEKDPFVFDRTLVATVTKGLDWEPGDRMMWSRVLIQPINFLFAGYSVAATENETVKVTSIEATKTRRVSAELGLTFPGAAGPKASAGPSDEHVIKTTEDISAQFEKLGVDIMPNFLRIIRESETGGDVQGNTLVSLSVVTDPITILQQLPVETVQRKSIRPSVVLLVVDTNLDDRLIGSNNEQASITVLPQAPLPHCPLLARVWMLYQKRDIVTGRESYEEGLQNVSFIKDADPPKDIAIVSADDISPAAWSIEILPRDREAAQTHDEVDAKPDFVEARVGDGPWRSVVFTDYTKASKLARWFRLNSEAMMAGKAEAKLGELNFNYPAGASFVPFKNTNANDCDPKSKQKNPGLYNQQNAAPVGG